MIVLFDVVGAGCVGCYLIWVTLVVSVLGCCLYLVD